MKIRQGQKYATVGNLPCLVVRYIRRSHSIVSLEDQLQSQLINVMLTNHCHWYAVKQLFIHEKKRIPNFAVLVFPLSALPAGIVKKKIIQLPRPSTACNCISGTHWGRYQSWEYFLLIRSEISRKSEASQTDYYTVNYNLLSNQTIFDFSGATASFALTIGMILRYSKLSMVACKCRRRSGSSISGFVNSTCKFKNGRVFFWNSGWIKTNMLEVS